MQGTTQLSILGEAREIAAALDALTYSPLPYFNGLDLLTISARLTDAAGSTLAAANKTVDVIILPVNDPPSIVVPPAPVALANRGQPAAVRGIFVLDRDVYESPGAMLRVSLEAAHGTMAIPPGHGVAMVASGDGRQVSLEGDIVRVNRALDALAYLPEDGFEGDDVIRVHVDDEGNSGLGGALSAMAMVNITVAPAPEDDRPTCPLMLPRDYEMEEDGWVALLPSLIRQVRTDALGAVELHIESSSGQGAVSVVMGEARGLAITSATINGTSVIRGRVTELMTVLAAGGLRYSTTPDWHGVDHLHILLLANGNGSPPLCAMDSVVRVAAINDRPSLSFGKPNASALAAMEDTPTILYNLTVTDVDVALEPDPTEPYTPPMYRVRISASNGTVRWVDLARAVSAQALPSPAGSLAFLARYDVMAGLLRDNVAYLGRPDYFGPDVVVVEADDLGYYGRGGPMQASLAIDVDVAPVNDPPVITIASAARGPATSPLPSSENGSLSLWANVSVDDVDAAEGEFYVVTLEVESGMLMMDSRPDLTFLDGTAPGRSLLRFTGPLPQVNIALRSLAYSAAAGGKADRLGADLLTVTAVDGQGAEAQPAYLPMRISRSNSPPQLSLNSSALATGREDTPMPLRGAVAYIAGSDGAGHVTMELRPSLRADLEVQAISTSIETQVGISRAHTYIRSLDTSTVLAL